MGSILQNGKTQFIDGNGFPLVGGSVTFYAPGTENPSTTWQDSALTIPNVNPVVLDAKGQAVIWGSGSYRQVVKDRFGVTIWDQITQDASQPITDFITKFSATTGASLVGFQQTGTGAVARTVQAKLQEGISVLDFGAKGNGVADDSAAFQAALNVLPAAGGVIYVPSAAYVINIAPNEGTKSVTWNFGTGASFSGTAGWPRMVTNVAQVPVGLYIKSQSSVASPTGGGIAALNVEMLAPASYVGQSVAAYIGATGSNPSVSANVWAINCLINVAAAAGGTYQCIEVDVDNFSPTALVKGISINGVGSVNPQVGLEVIRTGGVTKWNFGLDIYNCVTGIRLNTAGMSRGIVIGNPAAIGNTALTALQMADSADSIVIQRATDTTPTGFAIRLVNAANNATPFSVDISGNISSQGLVTASSIFISGPATKTGTGTLTLGAGTSQTVGAAGGAAALPATPLGYFQWLLASTSIKIPYYNS